MTDDDLRSLARRLRMQSLQMVATARSSHLGSCFSIAEVMALLYGQILRYRVNEPDWPGRDRLIVSKGHAAAVVYAAIAEAGFIPLSELQHYAQNGSRLWGHVTHAGVPGIELSTGSLGHGLPVAVGVALTLLRDRQDARVFVVMSDGELDEGSNWEALLFAGHHRLDNLTVIVDYNKIQSLDLVEKTLALEPLADKFRAFGWAAIEVDGHDVAKLRAALETLPAKSSRPTAVIAHTIKGKGVSFMENTVLWHYRYPAGAELAAAVAELGGSL
jgi:transketolase